MSAKLGIKESLTDYLHAAPEEKKNEEKPHE
jgi:hypothetical protein